LICPFKLDVFAASPPPEDKPSENGDISGGPDGAKDATTTSSILPAVVLDALPTIRHDDDDVHTVLQISDDIGTFISKDLNVDRLNGIHGRMWMCGRPMNARALHRQVMNNRKIVQTEQADLHLLYYNDVLLLKPLPAYLLCPAAWNEYLVKDPKLHQNASGFLLSYIWLIRSPLDFELAKEAYLLPPLLTWPSWKLLVPQFLQVIDATALDQVNKRYQFGELRLGRINTIYRTHPKFFATHFVRGYLYGYNRYVVFFQRNVGWVLVVFVWFSLILSAMQVGTTVQGLETNSAFNKASYGFVIYSIVMVAVLLLFVGGIFVSIYVFNMFAAIHHAGAEQRRRAGLADQRKKKDA
jgi:succinate dehydrogenase/fumarate reductase cytochrome b subunit